MIARFSLYGFLKNQRYFEPFLVLAFVEKGLSFFAIGGLIAFRELATNLLEIPSGAAADLLGRRRAMLASFLAYIASFCVFGFGDDPLWLFPAMFLYAIGDAFRTGTHKAMIFQWLRSQGRETERTRVYGYTRSWSKLGSAVAVAVGTGLAFVVGSYATLFLIAIAPYALNAINLAGYPRELDGQVKTGAGIQDLIAHTRDALRDAVRQPTLRRLVVESMSFEGVFHATKDFLQPLLAGTAVALTAEWLGGADLGEVQRSVLLVGPVYFFLHVASSIASRNAHRFAACSRDDDHAARRIWAIATALFALLAIGELAGVATASVAAFVTLHVLQNVWRPILISRFDAAGNTRRGATTLSIESQGRRFATMVAAPLVGLAIDSSRAAGHGYWPIGAIGGGIALVMWAWPPAHSDQS